MGKELAQMLAVTLAVRLLIEAEANAATGRELRSQIVEKKVPLRSLPETRALVTVEANHERSDEIEWLA